MNAKDNLSIRPGAGWKYLGGAVYGHKSGARIHVGGLVRLPGHVFLSLNKYPECMEGFMYINICGGNRRRGLMTWARNHAEFV